MRLTRAQGAKLYDSLAATNNVAALMADGSVRTQGGELLVKLESPGDSAFCRLQYEDWCRRAARALNSTPGHGDS